MSKAELEARVDRFRRVLRMAAWKPKREGFVDEWRRKSAARTQVKAKQ